MIGIIPVGLVKNTTIISRTSAIASLSRFFQFATTYTTKQKILRVIDSVIVVVFQCTLSSQIIKTTPAIRPAKLELNTFSADLYKAMVATPESKHWKSSIGIN